MADEEQTAKKSPWYKRTWMKVLGYSFVFLWGFAVGDTESGSPEERLERAKRDLESATVQRLLEAGTDPNRQDPAGTTALMTAAISGQSEVVQHLVAAGADPNIQDQEGKTALMWAVISGQNEVVHLLVAAGADPNIKDKDGHTALELGVLKVLEKSPAPHAKE